MVDVDGVTGTELALSRCDEIPPVWHRRCITVNIQTGGEPVQTGRHTDLYEQINEFLEAERMDRLKAICAEIQADDARYRWQISGANIPDFRRTFRLAADRVSQWRSRGEARASGSGALGARVLRRPGWSPYAHRKRSSKTIHIATSLAAILGNKEDESKKAEVEGQPQQGARASSQEDTLDVQAESQKFKVKELWQKVHHSLGDVVEADKMDKEEGIDVWKLKQIGIGHDCMLDEKSLRPIRDWLRAKEYEEQYIERKRQLQQQVHQGKHGNPMQHAIVPDLPAIPPVRVQDLERQIEMGCSGSIANLENQHGAKWVSIEEKKQIILKANKWMHLNHRPVPPPEEITFDSLWPVKEHEIMSTLKNLTRERQMLNRGLSSYESRGEYQRRLTRIKQWQKVGTVVRLDIRLRAVQRREEEDVYRQAQKRKAHIGVVGEMADRTLAIVAPLES